MSNNDNSASKSSSIHPETPRTSRNTSNGTRVPTPSFTFSLSFSPSFSFNSPISAVSPSKVLNISNNLNRVVKRQLDSSKEFTTTSTTPNSNTPIRNRFLDSLTKAKTHSPLGIKVENDSNDQSDDELWTTLDNDDTAHANLTKMTTISHTDNEDGKNQAQNFLTPQKLIMSNDEAIKNETSDLKPSLLPNKESESNQSKLGTSSPGSAIKQTMKRRKLSNCISDSPNNSVAFQIDSMESPVAHRQIPMNSANTEVLDAASAVLAASTGQNEEKVWYPELDDVLIKSFLKYREFRENQTGYNSSTVLKNTSQNKVLSRMLLNKTGILRTSKQISSRLFRLSKSNRLDKKKKGSVSSINISTLSEIEELISTPLEQLVTSTKENGVINEHDFNALLSSSPGDDSLEENSYELSLNEFSLRYKAKFNSLEDHTFARFNTSSISKKSTQTIKCLEARYKADLKILKKLHDHNLPVWLLEHDINATISRQSISTSTPMSASSDSHFQYPMNLMNGSFESFMKVKASSLDSSKSFLNWNIFTEVYKGDCKLFEAVDIINGYFDESTKSYWLQIPFMRNFLSGYISYLVNGVSMITPEDNLRVVQVIYNNQGSAACKFDSATSNIKGYIIHQLDMGGTTAKSRLTEINLEEDNDISDSGHDIQTQADDDNETVFVGSSPCKDLSPNNSFETPQRSNLRIDINRANVNTVMSSGPKSAPIIYTMQTFRKDLPMKGPPPSRQLQQNLAAISENSNQAAMVHSVPMPSVPQFQNPNVPLMPTNPFHPGNTSFSASSTPYMNAPPNFRSQSAGIIQWDSEIYAQELYSGSTPNLSQNTSFLPKQGQFNQGMQPQHPMQQFSSKQVQFNNGYQYPVQYDLTNHQQVPQMPQNYMNIDRFGMNQTFEVANVKSTDFHSSAIGDVQNKENIKPMEIKFGPILEYDPSKDTKKIQQTQKVSKQPIGTSTFSINPPVSMYKPNKK